MGESLQNEVQIQGFYPIIGKINSELDKINGIGEKRRKALLTTFKTIDKIKEATLDELLNVKEMDSKSAQSVYDYFRRNSDV